MFHRYIIELAAKLLQVQPIYLLEEEYMSSRPRWMYVTLFCDIFHDTIEILRSDGLSKKIDWNPNCLKSFIFYEFIIICFLYAFLFLYRGALDCCSILRNSKVSLSYARKKDLLARYILYQLLCKQRKKNL